MSSHSTAVAKRKIFLIDDHEVLREGLRRLLNEQEDLVLSGDADDARKAYQLLADDRPDLVIVDISLPSCNGIELIKNLRSQFPSLSVLVLSMHDETLYAERALRAGAKGYIMKQASAEQFLIAIRTVLRNELYLNPVLSASLLRSLVTPKRSGANSLERLSDRELEILRLVGGGFTTREIATNLSISVKTVESHRGNIRQKLQLKNGAELMRFALSHREGKT